MGQKHSRCEREVGQSARKKINTRRK